MKDIYEMFNDIEVDESEFEEMAVSEIEKERVKKNTRELLNKEKLNGEKKFSNKKRIAIAAAITLVCVSSTIAIKPALATNIPIIGDLFRNHLVSVNKQYADYLEMIGKTKSCEGIDVTFESAVADNNMLSLNFIVKNNNKEIKDNYRDALLIPTDMKVNGKNVSTGAGASWEFIDNNTIRVLKKIDWSSDKLPNKMNIDITISGLFGKSGDWGVKFFLDKSKQVENTFEKKVKTKVDLNGNKGEISTVIATPLTVTIKGEGENCRYDETIHSVLNFIAFDDKGNGLRWNGAHGETSGYFSKTYKWSETFISNYDMKGATIIPIHVIKQNENGEKLSPFNLDISNVKPIELTIDKDRSISIKDYFIDGDYLIVKYNEKYFGKDSLSQIVDTPIYVTVDDAEVKDTEDKKRIELSNKYNDLKYTVRIVKVGSSRNIKVGTYDGSNVKILKDKTITVNMKKS